MAGPSTGALINNTSYTHDAMIDAIVGRPDISQGELARAFGYTESWISQVVRSDSFQQMLAKRKTELVDPIIRAQLDERLTALAHRSADILFEKLDAAPTGELALRTLELTTRAKGYGAGAAALHLTQNFVVAMPAKSIDAAEWTEAHKPRLVPSITIDTPLPDGP